MMIRTFLMATMFMVALGCTQKPEKTKVWIYTSLYKDTIADIQPKLAAEFPEVEVQFYQGGSEEVAAKVQAEILAGKIQADILISSDRFWYEELAQKGNLQSYKPKQSEKVDTTYVHPEGYYSTLSFPVMVLAYNSESIKDKDAPKTFKELSEAKWKDKVSMGSPLASGTSFTTVAFLVKKYGWDYFTSLRKNNLIAEGGNSGVVRRLQSQERPVGIVLLENVLRLTKADARIKYVIPNDGAIIQSNVLALVKKDKPSEATQKIADWMFAGEGQKAMAASFMYPATGGDLGREGTPEFKKLATNAETWSKEFIVDTMKSREQIKEQFSKIIF